MDLRRGSCLFCKNSVIIKQSSSLKAWQTLTFLFSKDVLNHDEFDKIKSDLKICPICFHKLVIVKRIDKNVKPDILDTSNASCLLCKNEKYLFQISSWPRFNAFLEEMSLAKNNNCVVCSDCFFYLETKQEIKGKLFSSYPQLNMKQRKIKENRRKWKVKFAPNIKFQSTPLKERNKKTVPKRKSSEDITVGSTPDELTENKINFDSLKKFKPLKDNVLFKNNRRLKSDVKFSNQIPYVLIDRSDLSIQNKLDDFGSQKIVPPETLDIQAEALNIKNEVSDKLNAKHVLEKCLTVIVVRMDMEKYIKSESKSEDNETRENHEKVNGNSGSIACQDVSLVELETSLEIKKRKSVSFAEEKNVEIEYFDNESNVNFRNRGVIDEQIVETPSKKLSKGILKRDEKVDTKNSMQNEVYEITDSEDECLSASKQIPEQNDNENESTAVVENEETDGSEEKDNIIVEAVTTGLRKRRQSTVDLDDFKADFKDSEDDESAMEEGSLDKAVFPQDSSNNDLNKDQNQDDNSKGVNIKANYKEERPVIIDLSDEENASNINESTNVAGNGEVKRNKYNDKKNKENKKRLKKRRQSTLVSDVSVDESNTIDFEDNEGKNNLEAADKQSVEDEQEVENDSTQCQIDENESHDKRSQTSIREKPRPLSKKRKANIVDSEIAEKEISKNDSIGSQEICPNQSLNEETNNQKRKKHKPKPLSKKKKLLDTSKNIMEKNVSGIALERDDDENHSGKAKDDENLSDRDLSNDSDGGNHSNTDLGIDDREDCGNGLDEDKDNGNVSEESFTSAENDTSEIDGNQDIKDIDRSENSCQNSENIDQENGDQSDLGTDYCTTNELRPTVSSLDEQKTIAIDVNESDSSEEIHDRNVAAMTNDRDSEENDSTDKGETEQSGSLPESEVKQLVSKYLDSVDDSNALLKSGGKDVSLKEASDPNFGEVSDEELTEDLVDSGISKKIDSESFNVIEKNDELGISEIDNENINSMLSQIFSEDLPDDGLLETKNNSKSEDDLADDATRGVKRKAIDDELDISKEKKKKKVTFCDDVT